MKTKKQTQTIMKELFYCFCLFTLFVISFGTQPPTTAQSREMSATPTALKLQALRDKFNKNDSLLDIKKTKLHINGFVINKKPLDSLKKEVKSKVTLAARPLSIN